MRGILTAALDRVASDADATQLLVLTPDTETAVALAEVARTISDQSAAPLVAITSAPRGSRILTSRTVTAIAATPSAVVALMRASAVKLDGLRTVVLAWADEMVEARENEALEVVLAEIPKEASRVVVADRVTSEIEALVERHLRRATRQISADSDAEPAALAIRYVTTTPLARPAAFRRLLDDLDPPSVVVVASEATGNEARATVASLGYHGDAMIRVETAPVEDTTALVVFYDLPSAANVAKVAANAPAQVVALVTPREIPALRRLTSEPVEVLDVSRAAMKARAKDERLRAALRAELQSGFPTREVMALEPLLTEFDALEIAAAALRLMERQRAAEQSRPSEPERAVERRPERSSAPTGAERGGDRPPRAEREQAPRPTGAFTRVFLTIGERDGVRAGDLVGAISGETGISSDRIGKLEIRDGHTVAEIASADADAVIEKLNGVTIKGRRIAARIDDRPAPRSREAGRPAGGPRRSGPGDARRGSFRDAGRSGPREGGRSGPREGGRSGPREGGRAGFGDRPRDRGPRSGGRDRDAGAERRPRREGRDEGPRGRGGFRDRPDEGRVPRAAHEREEWTDRADRVRNARRPRRDET
jgi:ATP-dependent RNA helicase DeaD